MTEQSRIITEEQWKEYLDLKEQVKKLKEVFLKLHPEYKEWLDKNFGETDEETYFLGKPMRYWPDKSTCQQKRTGNHL